MPTIVLLEEMARDLRFGIRNLRKAPGFAAMAAGSLALGIGATTAMFSVIYAVLINPFPYKDVAHLVSPKLEEPGRRGYRTYYTLDQYLELAQRNTIFDGLTISTIDDVLWTDAGEPRRLRGNHVTANAFSVMGVPALIGRVTTPTEADADRVAVLGYRFWQRQFAGDPSVIGERLTLDGNVRTIIGIMPRRFMFRGADVYLPIIRGAAQWWRVSVRRMFWDASNQVSPRHKPKQTCGRFSRNCNVNRLRTFPKNGAPASSRLPSSSKAICTIRSGFFSGRSVSCSLSRV